MGGDFRSTTRLRRHGSLKPPSPPPPTCWHAGSGVADSGNLPEVSAATRATNGQIREH
ncbi:MAG: hypothetical protein BLITH_1034 [Brockia lithotrophica]|uniref:Uncharacterized protein n=1 Tax=Brockia lithotrophica TaxID=933949 RepID=A0A2T5G7A4_9BACL|nr:MAG: hypothetical protein BLITH_1034 [Brockia lithotrophica]